MIRQDRQGKIYKITNLINGKIYIGKTIRSLQKRWNQHVDCKPRQKNYPIHKAISKYGKDNFKIECIEDGISEQQIDQRERYYIKYYNAQNSSIGYNETSGGDGGICRHKLTWDDVDLIIQELKSGNNKSDLQIGKIFNVSPSTIQGINLGRHWFIEGQDYPIRSYTGNNTGVSLKKYLSIVDDIVNKQDLSLSQIAKNNDVPKTVVYAINSGKACYTNSNPYYKGNCPDHFPIRINYKIDSLNFNDIFYEVLFTKKPISKIERQYHVGRNTINDMVSANKTRKNLTKDYILPMRKHLQENRKIWLEKNNYELRADS